MFAALKSAASSRAPARAFSTSASRAADVAKLTLVGRLGREPELKTTKTDKEYVTYVIATSQYPAPPPDASGERPPAQTTWHRIFSFNPSANKYLQSLKKGTHVYAEANFELREPDKNADPTTPEGQRQIFLRHEMIRVLGVPKTDGGEDHE
ncbi:hypothetical protein BD626DRAFT_481771 [Schizophyllum amplum]|uniref:Nucleic acid-binding protein n=1 Tax=Schizophyllum amplum TaxID=97359 RepID=A0A550CUI7_9AGAR|nr:hypothetical protein BD626DRAFT_481771 [Auriculariopsis ampla]